MKKIPPEVVSALQEFARTFVFGLFFPIAAFLGIVNSGIDIKIGGFNINWILALSVLISGTINALQTAVIKAGDTWLHKKGIETPFDFKMMDTLKK